MQRNTHVGTGDFMGRLIHFRSALAALVFMGYFLYFSENIATNPDVSIRSKSIVLMLALSLAVYITWHLGRRILYIFVPVTIVGFTYGLLYFIDPPYQPQAFVFFASILFYLNLLGIVRDRDNPRDVTAKSFLSISLIAALFLSYSVTYGVYINYQVELWVFLLLSFFIVFLLTFTSLHLYSDRIRRSLLSSLVLAFAMLQLGWMANFWPFNYSTMAVGSLLFYYVLWDMVQSSFTGTLSKRTTLKHIVVAIVLLVVVLFSAQWTLFS